MANPLVALFFVGLGDFLWKTFRGVARALFYLVCSKPTLLKTKEQKNTIKNDQPPSPHVTPMSFSTISQFLDIVGGHVQKDSFSGDIHVHCQSIRQMRLALLKRIFSQCFPTTRLCIQRPHGRTTEKKQSVHDHHRKKIFWGTFWPQRKTFQVGGGYENPMKTKKAISTTEIFPLWPPLFFGKEEFCTGPSGSNELSANGWNIVCYVWPGPLALEAPESCAIKAQKPRLTIKQSRWASGLLKVSRL